MNQAAYQRARSSRRKEERAAAFLEAARNVAGRIGVHETTLSAIAEEAGMHHSALRRYFPSREAVLLRLTAEGWTGWADRIEERLDGTTAGPDDVAETLVETLVADTFFCDLLGNVALHLERAVDQDELLMFKQQAMGALSRIVTVAAIACPELGLAGARSLMTATNSLSANLWQVCHPAPSLAAIYERDPSLGHRESDFPQILRELLTATARGLATPNA